MREGSGFVALVGPGLTEGVDEDALTTNALWRAVTGTEGTQDWFETARVFERPPAADLDPEADKERKVANAAGYADKRARSEASKQEPLTEPQLKYLSSLATKVSRERFDEDFTRAIKGSSVEPRRPEEKTQQVVARLTKDVARKLITALSGQR